MRLINIIVTILSYDSGS